VNMGVGEGFADLCSGCRSGGGFCGGYRETA